MTRFMSAVRADPSQVDADIGDELAWHLEHLAADLQRHGLSPDAAAAEARRRFGDQARVARQCRAIVLKEQTMLRKLHLALTITLAALLGLAVLLSVYATSRARQEADRARAMAMEARAHFEQTRQAEQALRKQLEDQLAKPK